MNSRFFLLLAVSLMPVVAFAQRNYPPKIPGAKEMVYKTVGETELKLWGFYPKDTSTEAAKPAVIFFFGGGWKSGSPNQFVPQAEHLASKGMVAFVADYRVSSRHGTKAKDCVADARDAMRYVRANANKLGIDPDRLAAGGGSAGGHIAACLGVIEADADSKPNAMFLFNPACVIAPIDGKNYWKDDRREEMEERMGVKPEALSPVHHVTAKAPPCIIFHGEADDTVPYATAEVFAQKMTNAGVNCVLHGYPGEGHGFFNAGRKPAKGNEPALPQTLKQLDAFLVKLGWIKEG